MTAATLAAVVLAIAASPGAAHAAAPGDRREAARFLATVVRQLAANDYAHTWKSLHPVDQALVPRNAYVACESAVPVPGHLASIRTLSIGREHVQLTTGGSTAASVVVRFSVVIAGFSEPDGVHVTVRAHAIRVGGKWRWTLSPARNRLVAELRRTHLDSGCVSG